MKIILARIIHPKETVNMYTKSSSGAILSSQHWSRVQRSRATGTHYSPSSNFNCGNTDLHGELNRAAVPAQKLTGYVNEPVEGDDDDDDSTANGTERAFR